ncbi:MAG: TatD family hydrolase [Muribaculaceae bacterium]
MIIFDCHTHHQCQQYSIINVDASNIVFESNYFYSAGIHPWWIENASESLISNMLKHAAQLKNVVAIGECGIDHNIHTPVNSQQELFLKHIDVSESTHKPLIIHCVRAWQEIIAMHRSINPAQPWIIHGFRAKPQVAEMLLNEGLYLSFGEKFNTSSLLATPLERLFIETDDSIISINEVAERIAFTKSLPLEQLAKQINSNATTIFGL